MTEFIEKRVLPLVMAFALGFLVAPDDRDARSEHYKTVQALAECQQSADTPVQGIAMQHYAEAEHERP